MKEANHQHNGFFKNFDLRVTVKDIPLRKARIMSNVKV